MISTKILLIIIETFLNKYIINFVYNNVKLELQKLKLDELQYLGLDPKVEISFMIILILSFYYIVVFYGIFYDFIDKSLFSKIFIAIVFLFMFFYGLMGVDVEVCKKKYNKKYILNTSYNRKCNLLSSKIGRYKYGIIIGDHIFKYEDILGKYKEDNNLIIVLKNNDKIIIKDKKAEEYLKKFLD
ncbi:hypothetical protein FDF74_04065 [Clostridium niameyense]|uniref:Uncharacterized protein n=1 Tax=Clostridium niameyense TaxID=1622073 RepID=A0A6M0RAY1_9CLOT|nr:hypothetical protein [Clostridium niameyense]NEZ46388.1 hypothetical protein [Clostridium niameyense]